MISQSHWTHNSITRNVLRAHVYGTEIILKSTDRRSNLSIFLYVQGLIHGYLIVFTSMVIRLNCFSKMWRISLSRILQNNDLQCYIKTAGVITNDGFPECIILYNALCTMHAGETMHWKPCYNLRLWHPTSLIARFMGPTWGPDRAQVGPRLAPWPLLSGILPNLLWFELLQFHGDICDQDHLGTC